MDGARMAISGAFAVIGFSLVSCDRHGDDAARWLDLEISRPEVPHVDSLPPEETVPDADGMITNVIKVPESFFSIPSSTPKDPFGDAMLERPRVFSVQEMFEKAGIIFGPGSYATADPMKGLIIVRQTPDQMDLVEAYMQGMGPDQEREICIRLEVYALPKTATAELVRSAAPQTDHAPEHRAVIGMVRNEDARLLETLNLHCRSGQRALIEDGCVVSNENSKTRKMQPTEARGLRDLGRMGASLQVDPILGADQYSIDLMTRFEIHTGFAKGGLGDDACSLPTRSPHTTFNLQDVLYSGESRLIGAWPESREVGSEIYCLAFLQAFVIDGNNSQQP